MKLFYFTSLMISSWTVSAQTIINKTDIISPPQVPSGITNANGEVIFKADYEIVLKPGFYASAGANFHAYISPSIFSKLKNKLDASYAATIDKSLNFIYEEKYSDGVLDYKIYNYKREQANINPLPIITKTVGTNFISIEVKDLLTIPVRQDQSDAFFILEVSNDKGEKYLLRFKYIPNL